jgi:hypothetical protein
MNENQNLIDLKIDVEGIWNLKKNFISYQSENYNINAIKFEELIKLKEKKLKRIFISTFVCEWDWLISNFEKETEIYVLVDYSEEGESEEALEVNFKEGTKKIVKKIFNFKKNIEEEREFFILHPPRPKNDLKKKFKPTLHGKIILADFEERMR